MEEDRTMNERLGLLKYPNKPYLDAQARSAAQLNIIHEYHAASEASERAIRLLSLMYWALGQCTVCMGSPT